MLPSEEEQERIGLDVDVVKITYKRDVLVKTKGPEDAKKLIEWEPLKEKGLTVQLARTRRPRLEIMRVPSEWSEERLEEVIWNHLATRGFSKPADKPREWMRACFSNIERSGLKKTWVIEVHPKVRTEIMLLNQISGRWWDLLVRDYLDPPLCLKCQGYGHIKAQCKSNVICRWCGKEDHIAKDCPKKNFPPDCRNCVVKGAKETERRHCAGSRDCPVHLREMQLLAKRTNYD